MGSGGPEGPSRWPKATSPPQELEVGGRRPPYLLVLNIGLQYIVVQYIVIYSKVQTEQSTLKYKRAHCGALEYSPIHCGIVQYINITEQYSTV